MHVTEQRCVEYNGMLAEAGLMLMACESEEQVFQIVSAFLSEMLPDVAIIVNQASQDQGAFIVRAVLGMDESLIAKAAELLGFDPIGRTFPVAEMFRGRFSQRKLIQLSGGLGELAASEVPPAIGNLVARTFGVHDVYTIGITDGSTLFGALHFVTLRPDQEIPSHVIESLAFQCFLALRNLRTQAALRESEEKYRLYGELLEASPASIIVFDESGELLYVNEATPKMHGYTRDEFMALNLHEIDTPESAARISERFAYTAKHGENSFEVGHYRKDGSILPLAVSYRMTMWQGQPVVLSVSSDITQLKGVERELLEGNARLEEMVVDVAQAMGRIVEMRDPYTQGHEVRVAALAAMVADDMGMSFDEVAGVEMAALVHDIGKLCVPAEILNKAGALSDIEFSLVKQHPEAGYEILKDIAFPWNVAEAVLQHHERMDGSGYPAGLTAEQISVTARILAVADVIEAMASHRPYRPALGIEAAMAEIQSYPDAYDQDVVESCKRLYQSGRIAW